MRLQGLNTGMARGMSMMMGFLDTSWGTLMRIWLRWGHFGLASEFLETFTVRGFYPLVSLSSSLAVTTVTLINNIMMNNLEARMETSLVMVSLRPSSNLSICRGGAGWWGGEGEAQRVVSVGHNWHLARKLEEWDWREMIAMGNGDGGHCGVV